MDEEKGENMSRWKTAFAEQHAVVRIENCLQELNKLDASGLPPDAMQDYTRLLKILTLLKARFLKLDPELFGVGLWGNLGQWLETTKTHITGFSNSRNTATLHAANNVLDQLLNAIRLVDIWPTGEESKTTADAFIEEIKRVKDARNQVKTQLDSLSAAITDSRKRLEDNNHVIQLQKQRLDDSIAEFQKQFSQAQEKRIKDFADTISAFTANFEGNKARNEEIFKVTLSQGKAEYERFLSEVQTQSAQHLDVLRKREAEVNQIFGAIGAISLAGDFKKTADQEGKAADWLRKITLELGIGMVAIAIVAFFLSNGVTTPDWRLVRRAPKVTVTRKGDSLCQKACYPLALVNCSSFFLL